MLKVDSPLDLLLDWDLFDLSAISVNFLPNNNLKNAVTRTIAYSKLIYGNLVQSVELAVYECNHIYADNLTYNIWSFELVLVVGIQSNFHLSRFGIIFYSR